ncbi:uncharacterized protein [Garra rufa]|uniref:uncharacterized protein n=1 Tax=Garra rufa TaxID=137080 RepID=UPI003CCEE486
MFSMQMADEQDSRVCLVCLQDLQVNSCPQCNQSSLCGTDLEEYKVLVEDLDESAVSVEHLEEYEASAADPGEYNAPVADLIESEALVAYLEESNAPVEDLNESKALVEDLDESEVSVEHLEEYEASAADSGEYNAPVEDLNESEALVAYLEESNAPVVDLNDSSASVSDPDIYVARVAEQLERSGLQTDQAENVECDSCTGRKNKAIKTCLVCLASYCKTHLKLHNDLNLGNAHSLVDVTGQLQRKMCSQHHKLLEVYCCTDRQCICCLCMLDTNHKGHDMVSAATERAEKQVKA